MPVVRISRGSFKTEDYERIKARLDESEQTLVPAIRKLSGCVHYWAGIDPTTNTMVNVSVWKSLAEAKAMETLAPMLSLAGEFVKLGVVFERPIANYETLWQI
jgi:quinol monooxygenase YgiN